MDIISALFVASLIITLANWGGRCSGCKSWNNWRGIERGSDNKQPRYRSETHIAKCRKCGHTVYGETEIHDTSGSHL